MKYILVVMVLFLSACAGSNNSHTYLYPEQRAEKSCSAQNGRIKTFEHKSSGNYAFTCDYQNSEINDGL